MGSKDKSNLILTGDGIASGGIYNNVKIVGNSSINGFEMMENSIVKESSKI